MCSVDPQTKGESQKQDYFNLDGEIERIVSPEANDVFDDCDSLVKAFALADPSIQMRYISGELIELPVWEMEGDRHYQLERRVEAGVVRYTYRRLGSVSERGGFEITRLIYGYETDGHAMLSTLGPDDYDPTDSYLYGEMVESARERIHSYAEALAIKPESLALYRDAAILPERLKERVIQRLLRPIVWPFTAPYYRQPSGELVRSKASTLEGAVKLARYRHVSIARIAFLASLLPAPVSGSAVSLGSLSFPRPVGIEVVDDIINKSEHKRQGYDAKGIELPLESSIEVPQQEPVTLQVTRPLPTTIANELTEAPTLDANDFSAFSGEESTQDLYGGPRRLKGLGGRGLGKNKCDSITVNMQTGDKLRVSNIGANIADRVYIEVLRRKIHVCNISAGSVNGDQLENIYVQVVKS